MTYKLFINVFRKDTWIEKTDTTTEFQFFAELCKKSMTNTNLFSFLGILPFVIQSNENYILESVAVLLAFFRFGYLDLSRHGVGHFSPR